MRHPRAEQPAPEPRDERQGADDQERLRGNAHGVSDEMLGHAFRERAVLTGNPVIRDRSDEPTAILQGHSELMTHVAFSSDGRWLVTGNEDRTARVWDLRSDDPGGSSTVLEHEDWLSALALSADDE